MTKEYFVQQVTACTGLMYRVAYTMLYNQEDCKDAIQEAILCAWEKQHTLRDEQHFRPWLMRILTNICHDIQHHRGRCVLMAIPPEQAASIPDLDLALSLQALPEKYRLPMVLVYTEGMSYAEAAHALAITQATLGTRLHRAKKQLKKEWSEA